MTALVGLVCSALVVAASHLKLDVVLAGLVLVLAVWNFQNPPEK